MKLGKNRLMNGDVHLKKKLIFEFIIEDTYTNQEGKSPSGLFPSDDKERTKERKMQSRS